MRTWPPRGYGLVVERVLAKDEIGVRFPVSAPRLETARYFFASGRLITLAVL